MSYTSISIEQLNITLAMIAYLNRKIAEKSNNSGYAISEFSEEMIHSLSEFFDIDTAVPTTPPAKAA